MASKLVAGVALSVLALFVVMAIPAMITATNSTTSAGFDVSENETVTVSDQLELTANTVNASNATLTITDTQSLNSNTTTLNTSENITLVLEGEDINLTLDSISGNTATVIVEYPRTYGWNAGAKTIVDNLALILVVVAMVIMTGAMGAVIP